MSTLTALREPPNFPPKPLDLELVTRLLFCADGLTRRANVGGEDYHFRAAASAGALYPVEIYLVAGQIEGMEQGLYHFLPADLKLHGLRRGDWRPYLAGCLASTSVLEASAVLIMTSIFWRSAWKYRARAYRYCFWDAGTILANLLAAANADLLDTQIITAFEDRALEELLDIVRDREGIACLAAIGRSASVRWESKSETREEIQSAFCESPVVTRMDLESIPLSGKEVVYDDLVRLQRASRLSTLDEVSELAGVRFQLGRADNPSAAIIPDALDANVASGLGETILRRGSTRVFAREAMAARELAAIMATSDFALTKTASHLVETYLIINAVDGLSSGAYYYSRATGSFEPLKNGDFRAEAGYLCLEQPLGADCSALIIYMSDLDQVLHLFGNRGYRLAHLEAGLLGGRAYLASYSLGRGATGLTFYDDDTTHFFQPHCGRMSPLLMVAVGEPRAGRRE
jgi:SagB-type dehydrogenase family enzyme